MVLSITGVGLKKHPFELNFFAVGDEVDCKCNAMSPFLEVLI
jgi:hypothetical protein